MAADRPPLTVPRGRHAPPLQVRLSVQRRRLFEAAAAVFARLGYAEASAEAIAREAGMSKATFYEHFANKEECILGLFDEAATEVMRAMAQASDAEGFATYEERVAAGIRAFLQTLAAYPESAQTLLVEIIGAGPRAMARRDAILEAFAGALLRDNAREAPRYRAGTFVSPDDAFGVVGAIVELVSRRLRSGRADDVAALEPVIARLMLGVLR
jgi:AcrR family transcriptional regulator